MLSTPRPNRQIDNDSIVGMAERLIRQHVGEPYNVGELVCDLAVSRRCLECRFRKDMACTPYDYICRMRVKRAKQMLAEPQPVTAEQLARACGFGSVRNLNRVFRRVTGQSPTEYRNSLRSI